MSAERQALANAALVLAALAGGKTFTRAQREFAKSAWLQANRVLHGEESFRPGSLTDYSVALGLAEGDSRQERAAATLRAAIEECRATGMTREDIAGLLSRIYLTTPQRETSHA